MRFALDGRRSPGPVQWPARQRRTIQKIWHSASYCNPFFFRAARRGGCVISLTGSYCSCVWSRELLLNGTLDDTQLSTVGEAPTGIGSESGAVAVRVERREASGYRDRDHPKEGLTASNSWGPNVWGSIRTAHDDCVPCPDSGASPKSIFTQTDASLIDIKNKNKRL
jgi:hypothetical protein